MLSFHRHPTSEEITEAMLLDYSLEEILEIGGLRPEEALALLFDLGYLDLEWYIDHNTSEIEER